MFQNYYILRFCDQFDFVKLKKENSFQKTANSIPS